MRIALIVKKAMRSDPDVHSLGMTDLGVIRLGATDLSQASVCVSIYSHTSCFQAGADGICFCTESRVGCVESKAYALKLLRGFTLRRVTELRTELMSATTLDDTLSGAFSHES